jgi:hypothetical protein
MSKKNSQSPLSEKWADFLRELKESWRTMWCERFDDSVAAEGVAVDDYSMLFLARGTIVVATRKFKAPDFLEILDRHRKLMGIQRTDGYVDPSVGGWGKFIRNNYKPPKFGSGKAVKPTETCNERDRQQKKKGGRGWLHSS